MIPGDVTQLQQNSAMPPVQPMVPAAPVLDVAKLKSLGQRLGADFIQYEKDRRIAELQWMKNLRQFKGIYDPDIESQLDKNRSKAYPKLTRVKCVSMLSRLMNLLFPAGEKNWGVEPTPVPNLSTEDLTMVLTELMQTAQAEQRQLADDEIETAIREFARERGKNLEKDIEDQLAEIGGDRMVDYVALCRKVLMSGIMYGIGVLKGPFTKVQTQRRWSKDPASGMLSPITVDALRPQFEFIPVWDYYPDMSAKFLHRMDGQFTRYVMSRQQVRELADREDFFSDIIINYLTNHQRGNYKRRPYESELKALGLQINTNDQDGRKYEVIVWDGQVSGHYLAAAGIDVDPERIGDQFDATVWMIENEVIKADLNPWVMLEPEERINMFHHFIFEEDDTTILGNSLPQIMRDSQMSVAASSRMALDNGSVVCGPNLEVNTDLLRLDQDVSAVRPYMIWYREGTGQEAAIPAVREVAINSHIPELLNLVDTFSKFADQETFVNQATGGDMSKGPSEPFRTAAGASMLRGDAALPFKDVVRNFDLFTQSVMASLIAFNRHFNDKPTVRGDFQAVTYGSTSLIAKEVRGMAYDNLAQTLRPEEAVYVDWYEMAKERFGVRDIDVGTVIVSEAEARKREKAQQDSQAKQSQQMEELMRAEIRKLLADAVKSLTQSDKNAAAADAQTYNTILGGLEKGVTPEQVAATRAGAGVPPTTVQQPDGAGGTGPATSAGGVGGGNSKQAPHGKQG